MPLALSVEYYLRGARWYPVGSFQDGKVVDDPMPYHLNAPGAPAVAARFADTLAKLDVVRPGQIVAAGSVKLPAGIHDTRAVVALRRVANETQVDPDTRAMRVLRWYMALCDRNTVKPHYAIYKAMLKRLKETKHDHSDLDVEADGLEEAFIAAVEAQPDA